MTGVRKSRVKVNPPAPRRNPLPERGKQQTFAGLVRWLPLARDAAPGPFPNEGGHTPDFDLVPTLCKLLSMTHRSGPANEIVITNSDNLEMEVSSGPMTRFAGVSELLTGSTGIHMAIATIPPGRCSTAHYHVNCESAIYVLSGSGTFLSGEELDKEEPINTGDFIFVPPDANHQPVNTSETDDLVIIVARNAPVEIVVELEGAGRRDC